MLNSESVDFCLETLESHHNRAAFSCGNEQLDRYLHDLATQDKKRNIAIPGSSRLCVIIFAYKT